MPQVSFTQPTSPMWPGPKYYSSEPAGLGFIHKGNGMKINQPMCAGVGAVAGWFLFGKLGVVLGGVAGWLLCPKPKAQEKPVTDPIWI